MFCHCWLHVSFKGLLLDILIVLTCNQFYHINSKKICCFNFLPVTFNDLERMSNYDFKKGGRRERLNGYTRSNDVLLSYKLLDDGGVYHDNDKTPWVKPNNKRYHSFIHSDFTSHFCLFWLFSIIVVTSTCFKCKRT